MATQFSAAMRQSENVATWLLTTFYAALFAPIGLHLPYFPVWLAARGLSDSQIALTLSTPLVLRVVLTPVIAYIADRQGIAATLSFCSLLVLAAYVGLGFVAGFPLIFTIAILLIAAQGSMPALADALGLAEIRRLAKLGHSHIEFGRVRVGGSLSFLGVTLVSSAIVSMLPGARIIIALAGLALLSVVAAAVTAWRLPRVLRPQGAKQSGLTANPADLRLAIIVILAAACVQASHAEIYTFGTLHWQEIGLKPEFIALAWATGVIAESVLFVSGGRFLAGPKGALGFLVLGAAGAVVRWTIMSFDPQLHIVLLLQILHAASFAATYIGAVLFLGDLAGPHHRARIQGFSSAALALSMAASILICGKLTSLWGQGAYLAMAGLAGVGLVLALVAKASWRGRKTAISSE